MEDTPMENMKDNPISSAAPKLASDEELKAKTVDS